MSIPDPGSNKDKKIGGKTHPRYRIQQGVKKAPESRIRIYNTVNAADTILDPVPGLDVTMKVQSYVFLFFKFLSFLSYKDK
jgi:hypothetical protein